MKYNSNTSLEKIKIHKDFQMKVVSLFVSIFIIFSIFNIYPKTAKASIFSSIFSITTDEVSAKTFDDQYVPNSQNMTVLKAVVNVDPNPDKSLKGKDIAFASENALMAEIGPSGSITDIENQTNTQISLYTVRKGDTLSGIAEVFDVSVNTIIWANNIDRKSSLKEGQTLIILPVSGIQHKVKKGDTIKSIVSKYKADMNEVLSYNDLLKDSVLKEGDIIIIPDAEPTALQVAVSSKKSNKTTSKLHDANGPSYLGYYMRPISGGRESQGLHGYNAVDLAAPVGTPIYASAGGTVIASVMNGGYNGGYGNYVIISHPNGTQTLYAHCSVTLVSVGQNVDKGDIIAKIGMTGKTTGPHVHFEIRGARNPF